MSDISRKSIATLIDELATVSQKCWHSQELINDSDATKALKAARAAQEMNKRRCDLMRAIDERLDKEHVTVSEKTY